LNTARSRGAMNDAEEVVEVAGARGSERLLGAVASHRAIITGVPGETLLLRRALTLVMRLTTNRSADMPMMAALMASTLDTQAVLRGRE
jgi:hypothetical protein